jgi:hypothetical protein
MRREQFMLIAGVLHFGILFASVLVPQVLDWRTSLRSLDGLSRQLIWVHGLFIVLIIVLFGVLSIVFRSDLVDGTPLARGVCALIAVFWAARLCVQFFVFNAGPYLKTPTLKLGYHGLTIVFVYHVAVYSWAALS